MERGDTVRPTRRTVDRTNYVESSRLIIRRARKKKLHACRGCGKQPTAEEGELYAAGKEMMAPLCLDCVEPI